MQLNTIFFIGPQGSGKGTQARLLSKRLGFFYPEQFSKNSQSVSENNQSINTIAGASASGKFNGVYWEMGGILREVAKENTVLGKEVKRLVEEGILLDDDLLLKVVEARLSKIDKNQGVIFDGIPRRLGQAEFLMDFLKKQGRTNFVTIFLDIPKADSLERLLLRAKQEGRADDTKEKIELRLKQYYEDTLPVLDYLKNQTQFFAIDARPSIGEVDKSINQALRLEN